MTLLLPNWNGVAYNDRTICIMADSTGEGDTFGAVDENSYPMLIREKMRAAWGISGTGFLGTWRGTNGSDEWGLAGSGFSATGWTESATTDLWGQGPYIQGNNVRRGTQQGVGSTAVATFTLPRWLREAPLSSPNVGVILYMVDGVSSNNFSYSVDGGAWTDTAATWTQNSKMKRVNLVVTPTSTIAVRAATAAGTSRTIYLSGIEIKTSLNGATLHDVSGSGEGLYSTAYNNAAGGLADAMGFLDLLQPKATVVAYTNDFDPSFYGDGTRIGTDLDYIVARSTYGLVIPMMFWGQDRTNASTIFPAAATTYNSKGTSGAYIDLFGTYGDYTAVAALGYMADTVHPNDAGSREIARVLWRYLSRGDNAYRIRSSP